MTDAVAEAPSLFEQALQSYQDGAPLPEVIDSFITITQQEPRLSAGWTCLAWLQRVRVMAPELAEELDGSIADGLVRRPDWQALQKVQAWLKG